MNRYGKRCVLYPRVSTEMQVDGYSLEGQKNMLTRFADREEMIVVDTYEDAGKSGKSIEGRPAFQKMLRDIEDGLDIDYILVYKLSRFGRNAADILNSLELVQSYGVNLICIEEGIDSSQTSGKLLISVLSAVAEIERENIIEQTMNGRREKARQGGWNGGFAPYGYTLEDNKLMIEETEAVAIRKIFELYTSSEIGLGGIANQLNLQGIRKIPRQNGTLEDWTGHFIKLILDNPVYCGKIAYGRRTKEKVKGTKNDYQMKRNDDYILTEGQHKGIVSEEIWEKAHAKRLRTGVKQPSKIGRDRVHLLSGLLKCPVCGSPMYTNKHAWTNKDGTYKEIYYYVCSRNRMVRGKHCEYKAMLKKTDIEPMVIEAIREIVRNEEYAQAIKKRIGVQIDTKAVDKELEGYQAKLKEVDLNKTRLEREIDSLPADAKYRERKLHDMTLRLDSLYDVIVELEEKIEDARFRRDAIKQQAITLENIYKIMVNFDCVYNIINDEEKRNVVTALIKEIEIYRNDESEYPLKRIGLNFPVFKDGGEVTELLWDKGNTVDPEAFTQEWSTYVAKGKNHRYGLCFTWDIANIDNNEDYVMLPALTGPDGMRNITRQNNSETSGFDRGRCVLTSSCRDTALAAAWIDQMYAPLQSPQNNWGTYGEKDSFNIFELSKNKDGGEMLKHMDLGTQSPVEVREAQSVNGPLAVLNEYYDVYVTQPEDAKWRLDNMHETYLQDMNSKYVYPNVFMSIEDTNKVSQYDTDIKKYAEQKKADWILNGGIEKEWDSYLKKMEQYGLTDYLSIKQKYFDQYQKSLSEEK